MIYIYIYIYIYISIYDRTHQVVQEFGWVRKWTLPMAFHLVQQLCCWLSDVKCTSMEWSKNLVMAWTISSLSVKLVKSDTCLYVDCLSTSYLQFTHVKKIVFSPATIPGMHIWSLIHLSLLCLFQPTILFNTSSWSILGHLGWLQSLSRIHMEFIRVSKCYPVVYSVFPS